MRVVAPSRVKRGELEPNAAGVRTLIDHNVDMEVLHGGVKIILHSFWDAVDFVDE